MLLGPVNVFVDELKLLVLVVVLFFIPVSQEAHPQRLTAALSCPSTPRGY